MQIVYGGAFNPPTVAHFLIAGNIMAHYSDSMFYYLPAGSAYYKSSLVSSRHRIAMLELHCLRLGKKAAVSTAETAAAEFAGTYYSLKKFDNPVFVLGADNLATIATWVRYPDIVIENRFIVIPRFPVDLNLLFAHDEILRKYRCNFEIMSYMKLDISSSKYRNEKDSKYLLPEVAQYIEANNLYKE